MLPALQAWERARDTASPTLLVISSGSAEQNRAIGLTSPVLLDENFATGRALGASGTPSAIRVDGRGRIASDIAAGAEAFMSLASATPATAVPEPAMRGRWARWLSIRSTRSPAQRADQSAGGGRLA